MLPAPVCRFLALAPFLLSRLEGSQGLQLLPRMPASLTTFMMLRAAMQFIGVLNEVGWQNLAPVLAQRAHLFSPNYAADHAGAL